MQTGARGSNFYSLDGLVHGFRGSNASSLAAAVGPAPISTQRTTSQNRHVGAFYSDASCASVHRRVGAFYSDEIKKKKSTSAPGACGVEFRSDEWSEAAMGTSALASTTWPHRHVIRYANGSNDVAAPYVRAGLKGHWHGAFLDHGGARVRSSLLGTNFRYAGRGTHGETEVEPLVDLPRRVGQGVLQVSLDRPAEREGADGAGRAGNGGGQLQARAEWSGLVRHQKSTELQS